MKEFVRNDILEFTHPETKTRDRLVYIGKSQGVVGALLTLPSLPDGLMSYDPVLMPEETFKALLGLPDLVLYQPRNENENERA